MLPHALFKWEGFLFMSEIFFKSLEWINNTPHPTPTPTPPHPHPHPTPPPPPPHPHPHPTPPHPHTLHNGCNYLSMLVLNSNYVSKRGSSALLTSTQNTRCENRSLKHLDCILPTSFVLLPWWRQQMETFSALLAICAENSPHKGQWRGALMFSLICVLINGWVNNRQAGDLRRYRAHYDASVMAMFYAESSWIKGSKLQLNIPFWRDQWDYSGQTSVQKSEKLHFKHVSGLVNSVWI